MRCTLHALTRPFASSSATPPQCSGVCCASARRRRRCCRSTTPARCAPPVRRAAPASRAPSPTTPLSRCSWASASARRAQASASPTCTSGTCRTGRSVGRKHAARCGIARSRRRRWRTCLHAGAQDQGCAGQPGVDKSRRRRDGQDDAPHEWRYPDRQHRNGAFVVTSALHCIGLSRFLTRARSLAATVYASQFIPGGLPKRTSPEFDGTTSSSTTSTETSTVAVTSPAARHPRGGRPQRRARGRSVRGGGCGAAWRQAGPRRRNCAAGGDRPRRRG